MNTKERVQVGIYEVLMREGAEPEDVEGVNLLGMVRHTQNIPEVVRPGNEKAFLWARGLLDGGASYGDVARTVGVDRSTVVRWLPGRGWTPDGSSSAFIRKAKREMEGL